MINNKTCYFNNGADKIDVIDNEVYVNNQKINEINRGVDGIVYRYKDFAIKLYHDTNLIKEHLKDYQIDVLTSLKMKHIVLPKQKLISDTQNTGFVMEYINLENKIDILTTSTNNVLNQVSGLEEELKIMGQNNFLLEDVKKENLFYNGTLHLFDPDSFIYDKKTNFSKKNLEIFSWYFIRDVIFSLDENMTKKEQTALVRKLHYLYQKGKYTLMAEFLLDNVYKDNLYEFKKILKKKK